MPSFFRILLVYFGISYQWGTIPPQSFRTVSGISGWDIPSRGEPYARALMVRAMLSMSWLGQRFGQSSKRIMQLPSQRARHESLAYAQLLRTHFRPPPARCHHGARKRAERGGRQPGLAQRSDQPGRLPQSTGEGEPIANPCLRFWDKPAMPSRLVTVQLYLQHRLRRMTGRDSLSSRT